MSDVSSVIGVVSWDYDPPRGGLGRSTRAMVEDLRKKGKQVEVLSAKDIAPLGMLAAFPGAHILAGIFLHFRLRTWMDRHRIACVLAPCGPGGVFLPAIPVPLTAIVHHTYAQQADAVSGQRWKKLCIPWEKQMLKRAAHILCFSDDTRSALIEKYAVPKNRVRVIPQFFACEDWIPTVKERGLCVCVARLEKRKGVDVLLRAWPLVRASCPEARLVIVGDGILRRKIDAFMKKQQNVTRVSALSDAEIRSLMGRAEVVVCPTYLEGFGLAAAEAMAAGAVVVGTDVDGLRSLIVHAKTGMLSPPGDWRTLARHMIEIVENDDARARMADRAKQEIHHRLVPDAAVDAVLAVLPDGDVAARAA